ELVEKDRALYRAAVERTKAPLGKKTDPVASLAAAFEADLDTRTAAAELGLTADELKAKLAATPVAALAPLARGESVARGAFVRAFAGSARALGLGDPLGFTDPGVASLPEAAGRQRFEAPFGDRVLSIDVDRSWRFGSRRAGLDLVRDDGARIQL